MNRNRSMQGEVFDLLKDFIFPASCVYCGDPGCLICRVCISSLEKAHLKCLKCGKLNPSGKYCPKCQTKITPDRALALFKYDGQAKELIHKMKYEDCHSLSEPLGKLLARHLKKLDNFKDYTVTFVPVHRTRKLYRGYNQAELLAVEVADELKVEFKDLLVRKVKTESQIGLKSHRERRLNLRNSITAKSTSPEKIILIDDVITSGATIEECAKALRKVGAKIIAAAAICLG